MQKYVCKKCGKEFAGAADFRNHVVKEHGYASIQDYYDRELKQPGEGECIVCGTKTQFLSVTKGYKKYCSLECSRQHRKDITIDNKVNDVKLTHTCCICEEQVSAHNRVAMGICISKHLKEKHGIYQTRIYYDRYLKKPGEGICETCGKETEFRNIYDGYRRFCSQDCANKAMQKKEDGTSTHSDGFAATLKRIVKSTVESIKEKYTNFLRTDKKTKFFKTGSSGFEHKNISTKEVAISEDGEKSMVKTEISCSVERPKYIGTEQKYMPKVEFCNGPKSFTNEIMDSEFEINETEWC